MPSCQAWVAFALLVMLHACVASANRSCATSPAPLGYYCQEINSNYLMYWRVDVKKQILKIGLEIEGPNNTLPDWVGLGVSSVGGMKGASIVTLSPVEPNGDAWQLKTLYGTDYVEPEPVDVPGVTLHAVNANASTGVLRALYSRPLDACTPNLVAIELGKPSYIIWAYGTGGYPFSYGHDVVNTNQRGHASVTFVAEPYTGQTPPSPATSVTGDGVSVLKLQMPNVTIPLETDPLMCVDVELAPDNITRHITQYGALFDGDKTKLVHHILLMACTRKPPLLGKGSYQCNSMGQDCIQITAGWAMGSTPLTFPSEAGIRIGPGGYQYATLQIHYNNINKYPNVVDRSGLQLTTTTNLRKYDVGVMTVGSLLFSLPPGKAEVKLRPAWCPPACTKRFPTNLTVFSVLPHQHRIGKSITLRHVRGTQELKPLSHVPHWDWKFGPFMPVDRTVMPGDALIVECSYNTLSRTNMTRDGERTEDEMCFGFIQYYPRMPEYGICVGTDRQELFLPDGSGQIFSTCTQMGLLTDAYRRIRTSLDILSPDQMGGALGLVMTNGLQSGVYALDTPTNYTSYQDICPTQQYAPASNNTRIKLNLGRLR